MNKKPLAAALLLVALACAVPPASATVSAFANANPPTGIVVGVTVILSWTKTSNSIGDATQIGTVSGQITGPISQALSSKPYTLPASPTGGSVTITWNVTFLLPGNYSVAFTDAVLAGLQTNAQIPLLHVVEQPNPPASNGVSYDAAGNPVNRNWGDWLPIPGAHDAPSRTFLLLVNDGSQDRVFFCAFHARNFRASDGSTVPLAGNIAFQIGLGATPSNGMSTLGVDQDGHYAVTVGAGQTVWIGYIVKQLPSSLSANAYLAPYTIN